MVHYQSKNVNLGKFWRTLEWEMLVYFMVISNILRPLGIFYGHLVYFWPFGRVVVLWYIFPVLIYCVRKNLATLTCTNVPVQQEIKFLVRA
jgi:hypothetical protein